MLTTTAPASLAPIATVSLSDVTGGCHKGNCCRQTTVVNNNFAPSAPEPRAVETAVSVSYGAAR